MLRDTRRIIGAIFSDFLPENQLKSTLTWLATMWGIGPIIGPIISGYLQYYFNWQSCFYFFAFYGMSGFITMFLYLPETLVCKKTLQWRPILSAFREITQNKSFIGSMIIMGSTYSILVVFSTLGPFIIQEGFHQSVVYFSHVALSLGVAFLMGTFMCRYAIKRSPLTELLRHAILIGLTIILLMFSGFYYSNRAMMIVIFSSIGLVLISGILYPTGMAIGLSLFRHIAGSASAIMNFVNVLITSLVSFIMSFIDKNAAWMFVTYGILIMMTFLSYIFLVRPITGKNHATS